MNLCSKNHDEICFEGKACPMCEKENEFEADKNKLEERISELEHQVETAANE